MHRKILAALPIVLLVVALAAPGRAATKVQKFQSLSAEILETLQSYYPVKATGMGIHAYDHRLTDFSNRSVNDVIRKLKDFEKRLHKLRNADFTPAQKIDFKLIKSNVDIALHDLTKISWHKKSPQLYINQAVNGIYFLLLSDHAPMSEKLYSILARMRAVPELLATARKNIKAPPRVWIDLATESLESGIDFYQAVASELMSRFPERADEILRVSTQAREAMNDFLVHISEIQPGQPTAFAIGKDNFDYKLSHQYFLEYDSDSLLKIGQTLLQDAILAYDEYQEYIESYHQNGHEPVFVPASLTEQDILDYYNWETEQVRLFIENQDILSVPEDIHPVSVLETPPFLRAMISGNAYWAAGPFDNGQQGLFYVRPLPDELDHGQREARYRYIHRRGFRGSVVRKAYPGHHLQMQIAARNQSDIRKWQLNMMMIEGWALFSEEMMYSAGLYGQENPAVWLAILGGIRSRAARIVADVKLQTGRFTYQECADWLIEILRPETESERVHLQRSARYYTLTPTDWMTYLMGKREIERLRDAAKSKAGTLFNESDFYDRLLSEGSIPPALMWEIMGLEAD